MILLIIREQVR